MAITSGCATNADVCADKYETASRKDTPATQKQILEHNEFLKKMGCSEETTSNDQSPKLNLLGKFRNVFN